MDIYQLTRMQQGIETLREKYDPERDTIPNAPKVTYTDEQALTAIVALLDEVIELRKRIIVLENPPHV